MKQLNIEWKHLEKHGETCLRCAETGKTLADASADLSQDLESKGVVFTFTETTLSAVQISQSNIILFNGLPLEEVLSDVKVSENRCGSCSSLTGKETYCLTVEQQGKVYEEIPESIIRQAAIKAIALE